MKTMLIGHFMKVSLNLDYVRLDMHTVDKIRFWNSTNETTLRLVCRYGWVAMSQGAFRNRAVLCGRMLVP